MNDASEVPPSPLLPRDAPSPKSSTNNSPARLVTFALLFGFLTTLVALLAVLTAGSGSAALEVGGRAPAALVALLLLLVVKIGIDGRISRGASARVTVATGLGAGVPGAALGALAWYSVKMPVEDLISTNPVGAPEWGSVLFYLGVWCVIPIGCAVTVAISAWILRTSALPFLASVTRGAAALMSIALFGLTALAFARVSLRPGIDRYLEDLYERAARGHISGNEGERAPTGGGRPPPRQPAVREYRDTVDDIVVLRACDDRGSCALNVFDATGAPAANDPSLLHGPRVNGDAALVVLRVAPDLLLVKGVYSWRPNFWPEERSLSAFRRVETHWQDEPARVDLVVRRTSTPIAWIDLGLAGAGLTLALWVLRTLVSIGERRTTTLTRSEPGRVASVYRRLFVEAVDEPLAAECRLLRVDAAIVAVACCGVAPLVAAGLLGLLR